MRNYEDRQLALDCLRLAHCGLDLSPRDTVGRAEAYFAFVTGADADDAKRKLEAVREVVSQPSV